MQKVFAYLGFFLVILTVSCSNNVQNVVADENTTDSAAKIDNEQSDTTLVDKEIPDSESDNETIKDENEPQDENTVPDEDTVGNECSQNDDCSTNEFCAKETGSCETSVMGTCEKRPDDCFLERVISPVCGCDDYSYSSSCWAHAEGVVVKHDGQCDGDVMCWNNEACENDEFCEKKLGVCDTSSGVCHKKPNPDDCPPPGITQPFCGCDLYEYEDICYSASGGIPVKHEGKCNEPDDSKFYYFFGANAGSPSGYLKVVMSENDIREYFSADQHTENSDDPANTITVTINFKNKDDTEHAQLQFTVLLSDVQGDIFPFGMGLGYHESYLKVYDASENVIADMQGGIMIYDYSPLFMSSQIPTLDVRGLNLWVKE